MDILSTLFQQQSRKIGMIVPSVVISEKHTDTLEITSTLSRSGPPSPTMPTKNRLKW
jgi:hypothetical protein